MSRESLNEKNPVAPIDMTPDLKVPLLGLFGEDDQAPSPPEVAQHEAALKAAGKEYEFHMYPGAGHGFFYYDRAAYRQEQAVDGWNKLFSFFSKHLGS
jgi:carboxymethylenebutenolidase